MIRKKDLVQVFFLYLCLCQVCPAYLCGRNHLAELTAFARMSGMDLNDILSKNSKIRSKIYSWYKDYARCVAIVESGHYKRSLPVIPSNSYGDDVVSYKGMSSLSDENDSDKLPEQYNLDRRSYRLNTLSGFYKRNRDQSTDRRSPYGARGRTFYFYK